MTIFDDDADYAAFEQILEEAVERTGMRLLAYCVLPNHWHLVVWPRKRKRFLTPFSPRQSASHPRENRDNHCRCPSSP